MAETCVIQESDAKIVYEDRMARFNRE